MAFLLKRRDTSHPFSTEPTPGIIEMNRNRNNRMASLNDLILLRYKGSNDSIYPQYTAT